jgi:predicted peptidase
MIGRRYVSRLAVAGCCLAVGIEALAASTLEYRLVDSNVLVNAPNPREVTVYLPDGYADSDMLYPVAYFMHGTGVDNRRPFDGFYDGAADRVIASGDAHPLIIVAPHLPRWVLFGQEPVPQESWIVDEVMPFIEAAYRVDRRRERRAVMGQSSGGNTAVHFALKYDELFSVVGLLAPALFVSGLPDPTADGHDDARFPLDIWMWYGTNDFVVGPPAYAEFVDFLDSHELAHTDHVTGGDHFPGRTEAELMLTYVSDGLGPPSLVPTAVSTRGKLSTTWASMKSNM